MKSSADDDVHDNRVNIVFFHDNSDNVLWAVEIVILPNDFDNYILIKRHDVMTHPWYNYSWS